MAEQKPTSFADISESFNASAAIFLASPESIDLLLTKYSALQTFRLQERDDKEKLAAALFDTCEKFMAPQAKPGIFPAISADFLAATEKLLAELSEPENALLLPRRALTTLSDFALIFVDKAETAARENFPNWSQYDNYGKAVKALAPLTLKYAKQIKAVADRQTEDVSTSKNFTVPKPLVLKKSDKDRAP